MITDVDSLVLIHSFVPSLRSYVRNWWKLRREAKKVVVVVVDSAAHLRAPPDWGHTISVTLDHAQLAGLGWPVHIVHGL